MNRPSAPEFAAVKLKLFRMVFTESIELLVASIFAFHKSAEPVVARTDETKEGIKANKTAADANWLLRLGSLTMSVFDSKYKTAPKR